MKVLDLLKYTSGDYKIRRDKGIMAVKIAIIGGFLGSGKTTTIIQVGKKLVKELGMRVAIITNDQGEVLVDTRLAKEFGFSTEEVLQGCFCCKFPEFIKSARELIAKSRPEVILAEPVGSCADLPATVYAPLRDLYGEEFELAPFIVLVDTPKILNVHRKLNLLSPSLGASLFLLSHQICEAEVLALNKVDLVRPNELEDAKALLKRLNSRADVLILSAKAGIGLDQIIKIILSRHRGPYAYPRIDYDLYAKAESELGWFDGSWSIHTDKSLQVKEFIEYFLIEIAREVHRKGGEIAHLKLFFKTDEGSIKASLTTLEQGVDFTEGVSYWAHNGEIVLNARVKLDPDSLEESVCKAVQKASMLYDVRFGDQRIRSFAPPAPKPYFRLKEDASYRKPKEGGSSDF